MKFLAYADSSARVAEFFCGLGRALAREGHELVILTGFLSVYRYLKSQPIQASLLRRGGKRRPFLFLEGSFSVKSGDLTLANAERLAVAVWDSAEELNQRHGGFDGVFVWNGSPAAYLTLGEWAKARGISTLYFEIGNFPGKMFVDPEGVNARSRLAKNPEVLRNFPAPSPEYLAWKRDFLEKKLKAHVVPQSSNVKAINKGYALDWLGFHLGGLPRHSERSVFSKIREKFLARARHFDLEDLPSDEKEFIFFPLQVSSDSQVILNSDVDLFEALDRAIEIAKQRGARLVVKPHPAETNTDIVAKVNELAQKGRFRLVVGNTYELISRSQLVVTINSTVGIEALLLEKPVVTFGRAFFANCTSAEIDAYMEYYLWNCEFFSDEAISADISGLLSRSRPRS